MLLDLIMRKSLLKLLVLHMVILVFAGCAKDEGSNPIDFRRDYYPIEIGYEWIYDVQQINKTLSADDTLDFQLKETFFGLLSDSNGERLYSVYRYSRPGESDAWQLDSVWTLVSHENYIVKRENNRGFQKLIFPVTVNGSWDGNVWNTLAPQNYSVTYVDSSARINGNYYDEALFVDELDNVNLLLSKKQHEIYARNIGLVEYYKEDLETQPGEKTLGSIYVQRLVRVKF